MAFLDGRLPADLDTDRPLQLATAYLFHVISEAASHVSQDGRKNHPAIPWPETIALRDRVQDYHFRIDNDFVWHVVRNDLPELIAYLERAIPEQTR